MMLPRIAVVIFGAALCLSGAAFAKEGGNGADEQVPLDDLRLFAEVFSRVKQHYVDVVDDSELVKAAIRGLLDDLDPHSSFLSARDFEDLREDTRGEFGGLGIEVTMEDGFVKVIAPIDDTPAKKAGVKAGDLIIKLDNKPVKGMTLGEAVEMMRGKTGTIIVLTIMREGRDKPFNLDVTRAVIRVKSVKFELLDERYAYVRISSFLERSAQDMLKAISRLKKKAGGRIEGLILDLRNNPGGILDAAVAVSDAFLEEGRIVYTEGRTDDSRIQFDARPDDVVDGAPIVVLVDQGSASASEIVAGALQDHRRAVIMGHKTFGKGSVQTIIPVTGQAAVKLTTARYFTPGGRSIQAEGVVPDIELRSVRLEEEEPDIDAVTEAQLKGHLQNDKKKKAREKSDSAAELLRGDYALNEALNLLKGLVILKQKGTLR
ncbi:MAG: S41 family peptidase [Pseudomonadota bacterium]